MPELPEVETVCRGLAAVWEGRRFARVVSRRGDLRRPLPHSFAERLTGRRVERVGRRAKYILAGLDDGWTLLVHLGMSGRMVITAAAPEPPGRHDHVEFRTSHGTGNDTGNGVVVTYTDPRRFGLMDLVETAGLAGHPLLRGLGPEPLDQAFDADALGAALGGRRGPLKAALLDQRVVAGLGNIYACESLFRAGLAPDRPAGSLDHDSLRRLVGAIRTVLIAAIAAGGSSLRDHVQPSGEIGRFQHAFAVYGRAGEPCPGCDCGGTDSVRRIVQSGRSTFFCPRRQA
ncbi:MAG: bifunctional DNA-formamidopyrimidine glycosylase/DNA-(apurinic or apyrimidinic site) lyase [Alphaproteobacteria bacterium]